MIEKEKIKSNSPKNPELKEKMLESKRLTGNWGGRPAKFKTVEELDEKINEYFESFHQEDNIIKLFNKSLTEEIGWDYKKLPSMSGLAIALGFADRQSLMDYKNRSDEFSLSIKSAKTFIENFLEERLIMGKGNSVGIIFNLKNNFDWKDRIETDNTNTNVNKDVTEELTEEQKRKIAKRFMR